ncbi:lytic polysaccharide monooxygenase [Lentithecium fluviatile CBS 122367]|uniref:Lytic polysaccharide monooxygenase n=1 Tax=Lentithecium fluviatile CBS 122367 TaxID=1168545 RepID=A0A6G1IKU2_9PLEO|nr:lytic polysaccharide monooxygenase [Lentithecium fluviatile CBS 122367]
MSTLFAIAAFASAALAHGTVSGVVADGTYFSGWKNDYYYAVQNGGSIPTGVVGWYSEGLDNGYVGGDRTTYDSPDIICHKNAKAASSAATVKAGGTLDFQWTAWPESHVGPMITYVAKCDGDDCSSADKASLKFAKIEEAGFVDGEWAAISMIKNNNTWSVKVPETLAPGSYVFRHETIALHGAGSVNGAQNYPFCLNIDVTGSGSATPDGVLGTALYTNDEEGIVWNVYQADNSGYPVPGPALWDGASGSGSGSGSGSSTTAPSATAAPTSNSTTPVATATATAAPTTSAPATVVETPAPSSTATPTTGLGSEFTIDELEAYLTANTDATKEYTVDEIVALLEGANAKRIFSVCIVILVDVAMTGLGPPKELPSPLACPLTTPMRPMST